MFNILETVDLYEDTWLLTFYFVLSFSFLIGITWTCYQMFWKRDKKKQPLKENIIYNNSEDVIENYDKNQKKNQKPINNYKLNNFDIDENVEEEQEYIKNNNLYEEEKTIKFQNNNKNKSKNNKYKKNYYYNSKSNKNNYKKHQ